MKKRGRFKMLKADIGLFGLAVMGENLVLNIESRGFTVAVFNRTRQKTEDFAQNRAKGKNIIPTYQLKDFIAALSRPHKVMLMVRAGEAVDTVIGQLLPYLEEGDLIIDGGNSHYTDTIRRHNKLKEKGFLFIGTGISGGEQGALKGPSIMPGGSRAAYGLVEQLFTKIAAVADGEPCCTYIGDNGAGHYVKMVHNGIEYADMQLIAEAYYLMANALDMTAEQMHDCFAEWNRGDLNSYLIEITADILSKKDTETGRPMVDVIADIAAQKGTGAWTAQDGLSLGVAAPVIAEAVFARSISAIKSERLAASKHLAGPTKTKYDGNRSEFITAIHDGLYASKICSYAQGFALMAAAAKQYSWSLDFGRIARIWRAGCIIRAGFLDRIAEAFDRRGDLPNLLLDCYFSRIIERSASNWRRVVSIAVELGIAVPAFASALGYFDSYRTSRLSANLLQAQRDYFGAHTYQRTDKPGSFHTDWLKI
jgi:6-phosphogluconate dehydrogenase